MKTIEISSYESSVQQPSTERSPQLDPKIFQEASQNIPLETVVNLEGREISQISMKEEADNDFCYSLMLISGLIGVMIFIMKYSQMHTGEGSRDQMLDFDGI